MAQGLLLQSGRWQAAAGFAHAIGAAALVHGRRAQGLGTAEDQERALQTVTWLWEGEKGAAILGPGEVFIGLRGFLSYRADENASSSPFATAMKSVVYDVMQLAMGELSFDAWLERLTDRVSDACEEVLSNAANELRHVLEQPYRLVETCLGDEQQTKLLSGAPDKIKAVLGLLERAPPALEMAKAPSAHGRGTHTK